jgi:hypothetical protein
VLATAGVIAGFLGAASLREGTGVAGWCAIFLFAATAAACIAVLVPRRKSWTFFVSATILIEDHLNVPERNDAELLQRFLAKQFEVYANENKRTLDQIAAVFSGACGCLALSIVFWLLEFGGVPN